jgi:hypothetical protein
MQKPGALPECRPEAEFDPALNNGDEDDNADSQFEELVAGTPEHDP